ncbi:hypothetical protein JCM11251_004966 [Rhodosporidiobolus azoricus]
MEDSPAEYGDPQQAVYTRNQLLAVYTSPLVPRRLDGMKELAEWYGEFTEPPSPPPQRHGLLSRPSHTGSERDRGERGTPSRRPLQTDPSNPFTNFGRFGVDGGLGGALEEGLGSSGRRRRGERGADDNKEMPPHLGGSRGSGLRGERNGLGRGEREEGGTSPTRERSSFLTDRFAELRSGADRERRNTRNGAERDREGGRSNGLGGEPERRKLSGDGAASVASTLDPLSGASRKEMRRGIGPADEGGWRNVGLSREEREKRLIRNNASGTSLDSPRNDRDRDRTERGDRRDRDREFERNANSRLGGGRPSWMDDEGPSSGGSPAWMDAPATGSLSFGSGGKVDEAEDKKEKEIGKPPGLGGMGVGGKGGMDSIQAWKAQMKEMERKERERDLKAAGISVESPHGKEEQGTRESDAAQASVFSALTGSGSTALAGNEKSIFEDLGITRPPPGLPLPKQAGVGGEKPRATAGEGGRGSRFARFFDGKPPTTQAQSPSMSAAEAPSVFGALMAGSGTSGGATSTAGGAAGAAGPSKEDADSMARLLGMLQVSGARTSSPPTSMKSPPQPASPHKHQQQPPHVLPAPGTSTQPPSALASPALSAATSNNTEGRSSSRFKFSKSAAASPAQPAQPAIPQTQSPALAGATQPPPPGFGFPLSGPPTADPRSPPQQSRPGPPNGSNGASSAAAISPPAPQQQQQPPQQQQQPPQQHQLGGPFSPPPPLPGMPPPFFNGPPPPGARFPPGQLPPGMSPFALGQDGRPIPPPGGFPGPPPFPSPGGIMRNGPLSPPISNAGSAVSLPSPQAPHPSQPPQPNGLPFPPRSGPLSPPLPGQPGPNGMPPFPPPPHSGPFPPGAMPPPHLMFPGGPGGPPPPPPLGFLPPHLAGRGPPPPPPPGMFGGMGGGRANPGADLMALLNSGPAGTRIGPMGQPQGQQGPR